VTADLARFDEVLGLQCKKGGKEGVRRRRATMK
jgi:hypothetical protein